MRSAQNPEIVRIIQKYTIRFTIRLPLGRRKTGAKQGFGVGSCKPVCTDPRQTQGTGGEGRGQGTYLVALILDPASSRREWGEDDHLGRL